MPLVPPQGYLNIAYIHRRGLSTARPSAADVVTGTLYYSTDTNVLERSNGTTWDSFSPSSGTGGIPAPLFIPSGEGDFDDSPQVPLLPENLARIDRDQTWRGTQNFGATAVPSAIVITNSTFSMFTNPLGAYGGGIEFPSVQVASSGANVLDDYEEGTWTPALASSGGGSATYSTQIGDYTKAGRLVTFTGRIILASKGTLGAGTVTITGLPFTSKATLHGSIVISFWNVLTTAATYVSGFINPSATTVGLTIATGAVIALVQLTVADLGATNDFLFEGFYYES